MTFLAPAAVTPLSVLKDVMAVVGSVCMLLLTAVAVWIAVKRFRREKTKEEISAAEAATRLAERVQVLERHFTDEEGAHEAIRSQSAVGLQALEQRVGELDRNCERHKALLQGTGLAEVKESVRRINKRCDAIREQITAVREQVYDRFVTAAQHDKETTTQAQSIDSLQQSVNNLAELVRDLIRTR